MGGLMLRALVRSGLARAGYVVRSTGHATRLTGVDLLHDVAVLVGHSAPIIWDVGANVGQTIDAYRAAFRAPRITAFEPSPATFDQLRRTHGALSGVTLEPIALSDAEGDHPFHVHHTWSVNDSLLAPTTHPIDQTVTVAVTTADAYADRHGVTAIDVLKIDTQGADLRVLRGAHRLLTERRVAVVTAEINGLPMYAGQPSLADLLTHLDAHGYRLVGLYDQTYWSHRLASANICWARP